MAEKPKTREQAFIEQLKNPFPKNVLKFRVGATSKKGDKGIPLFYITARDVEKRLDEVCGPEGWQTSHEPIFENGKLIGTKFSLSLKFPTGEWVTREDVGESSKASPLKGAVSDGLKRAAVQFGIGRYLYYLDNRWMTINEFKQFTSDPRESLPDWALPSQVQNWEKVAEQELDGAEGIDFDNLAQLITDEERDLLARSKKVRNAILARAKES